MVLGPRGAGKFTGFLRLKCGFAGQYNWTDPAKPKNSLYPLAPIPAKRV
jgi:hypothetical protein